MKVSGFGRFTIDSTLFPQGKVDVQPLQIEGPSPRLEEYLVRIESQQAMLLESVTKVQQLLLAIMQKVGM